MPKSLGHLQTLSFGGTILDDAAGGCIAGTPSMSLDIDEAVSNCAGKAHMKTYTGNQDTGISFDLELEQDAVTLLGTTLARGTRGAVIYRPFGATATYVQIDATDAVVTSQSMSAPINGLVILSTTLKFTDYAVSSVP